MTLRSVVTAEGVSRPGAAFSTAIVTTPGRLLFVSGLLARDAHGQIVGAGDIAAQTRQICETLRSIVVAAGGTLESIVRLDIFVTDLRERDRIYAVRKEFFATAPPTSTMMQVVGFVEPDAMIEITAMGLLP
jgi:2-iminobutanoate/2-iminopropanoate deaminase